MELHIQKCQNCGSRQMKNILVRDETQKVYVQCQNCHRLVARYILASGGYFHAGKEFESFLRSLERDGGIDSGKGLQDQFEQTKSSAEDEFQEVLQRLKERDTRSIERDN